MTDFQIQKPDGEIIEPNPGPQTILLACDADEIFFGGGVGGGKGNRLDARISTPNGFAYMGNLKIGDEILNPDGSPQKVVGVHPLGKRALFKVKLADGAETSVTNDHLWLTSCEDDSVIQPSFLPSKQWANRTTTDLIKLLRSGNSPKIPTALWSAGSHRTIVSIEPDGYGQAQCITVDHPNSLYLCDDDIVTHNSHGLLLFWLKHHLKYGKHAHGMVVRQSYGELKQLIKTGCELLEPLGWHYKVGDKVFVAPDGAQLMMRFIESEEDVKKYWGFELTFLGVDEYADMPKPAFDAVQMIRATRLRSPHGVRCQFVATGNPCRKGHELIKERYIDSAPPFTPHQHPDSKHWIVYIPSTIRDNPKLFESQPEYINNLKSMGPSWIVKAMVEGDWSVPPQGNVFLRSMFNNRLAEPPKQSFRAHSWDTAFKKTKDSARSALQHWGIFEDGYYLNYAWAEKVEFPELKVKAEDSYRSQLPHVVWVEDKASGQSLTQEFQRKTPSGVLMPVKAIKVDGDKLARAYAITPLFETGKIFLPKSAPWLDDFINELCGFPSTGYCDQVDAASQALTELVKRQRRQEKFGRFGNSNVVQLTGSFFGV